MYGYDSFSLFNKLGITCLIILESRGSKNCQKIKKKKISTSVGTAPRCCTNSSTKLTNQAEAGRSWAMVQPNFLKT